MAQVRQMQIRFMPVEDRLLFRLHSSEQSEYRFWLTRRFVKILWGVLQQASGHFAPQQYAAQNPQQVKQAVISFQREKAMAQADFSTPYQEPAPDSENRNPLGEEPVLAAKISTKPGPNNTVIISIHPEQGKGIELALDEQLLHSFSKLVSDAVSHSDWDLALVFEAHIVPAGNKLN